MPGGSAAISDFAEFRFRNSDLADACNSPVNSDVGGIRLLISGIQAVMRLPRRASREIFKTPTRFYKAGIAFLSWLNGWQTHFIMPGGFQSSREITHYAQVFRLADQARLLAKPDLATERMRTLLALHGIV